ncbi:Ryanodine receptor 1 [Manis javanica]|nr:Ryanodine receptor 1 [Manis javanica]
MGKRNLCHNIYMKRSLARRLHLRECLTAKQTTKRRQKRRWQDSTLEEDATRNLIWNRGRQTGSQRKEKVTAFL